MLVGLGGPAAPNIDNVTLCINLHYAMKTVSEWLEQF